MKIALVDDEKAYRDEIAELCREFGEENSLKTEIFDFSDGESFLGSPNPDEFSLVFMDIFMNEMSGVETAKALRERNKHCVLIFLTSSGEYMPEAFSCHAFEYITKPFSREKVMAALSDALAIIPSAAKYIEVFSERKAVRLMLSEIVSVVSDAHYLEITTPSGYCVRCRLTMRQFMEQCGFDTRFLAINKGITVNADYVVGVENCSCVLENGEQFPIRVRDRVKIEQAVLSYNIDKIRRHQRNK